MSRISRILFRVVPGSDLRRRLLQRKKQRPSLSGERLLLPMRQNADRQIKCFKKGPTPASFSFIFGLSKQIIQFLQQINVHPAQGFEPTTCQHE